MAAIDALLGRMKEANASDLHLKPGSRPRFRVGGLLEEVPGTEPLGREEVDRLTRAILTPEQESRYAGEGELDIAYGALESARFRCNFFQEHRGPAAVFRRIPDRIPTLQDLHLPAILESLTQVRGGLALVTGPTGSGKTTTLAALIDLINSRERRHIITLEDPIEYLHPGRRSVVHQRGLHYDITDFASGIRAALREDPDVLLIGEMRDLETIRLALTAAEVGCLVFATLHTNGAAASIDRIIDVFPSEEQPQIRAMLSMSLAGVVSQVLLPRADGPGRIPATEILFATPAVGNLVRESKVQEIVSVIQAGKQAGMHTLDDSLSALVSQGRVAPAEAWAYAENKSWLEPLLPMGPPDALWE